MEPVSITNAEPPEATLRPGRQLLLLEQLLLEPHHELENAANELYDPHPELLPPPPLLLLLLLPLLLEDELLVVLQPVLVVVYDDVVVI